MVAHIRKGTPRDAGNPFFCLRWTPLTGPKALPSVAHNPEEHEEQVYKIEVKRQGSGNGFLGVFVGAFIAQDIHFLDLLGIISGEADKYQDTGVCHYPVYGGTLKEHVDDGGDDDAYQPHE